MKIVLLKATIADLHDIQAIGRATFSETFADQNSAANMAIYLEDAFADHKIITELNTVGTNFYLAKHDGRIVGYLKTNIGNAQSAINTQNTLEIERIYVLKEFHGLHVGQTIFDFAMNLAAALNVAYVWLGVWEKNHRAIRFYEKNGYSAFDQHIFYLGDDAQTDILMKRDINYSSL